MSNAIAAYIDPEGEDADRQLLDVFYSQLGRGLEVRPEALLRGIRGVRAFQFTSLSQLSAPAPAAPEVGEVDLWASLTAWHRDANGPTALGDIPAGDAIDWARQLLSQLSAPAPAAPEVREVPTWEIVLQEDYCAPDAREYFDRDFRRFSGGLDVGSFKSLAQFKERDCGMTRSWLLGGVELSISADDPFYTVKKRNRPATQAAPAPEPVATRQAGQGPRLRYELGVAMAGLPKNAIIEALLAGTLHDAVCIDWSLVQ
jgi:hypothetical protein